MKAGAFKDVENVLMRGVHFKVLSPARIIRNYKKGKFTTALHTLPSNSTRSTRQLRPTTTKEIADVVFALRSLKCESTQL
jgi:hypothetical protein